MKTLLFVFGTRPEAIKMIPVLNKLKSHNYIVKLCITGQHKEMLFQVLDLFNIKPDFNLEIMTPNQTLSNITGAILHKMEKIFSSEPFDMVFVHGDTSTTLAASLSAFYHKIPIAHIEAGLRTYDLYNPWPEEANRQLVSRIATYHFAPTSTSAHNLYNEGIKDNVIVTGNTVIDSLLDTLNTIVLPNATTIESNLFSRFPEIKVNNIFNKKYILVTGHRRENLGIDFLNVCNALKKLALNYPDLSIIYPVHLNPNVQKTVYDTLSGIKNVFLLPPLPYLDFIYMMYKSYLIITDSGGIQEEAPSLGKPVLVTRKTTERPEAVDAGTVKLVGTDSDLIYETCEQYLVDTELYLNTSKIINPYGDGKASDRIADYLNSIFKS